MTAVLSLPPVPVIFRARLRPVHVARFPADECFVRFHLARSFSVGSMPSVNRMR